MDSNKLNNIIDLTAGFENIQLIKLSKIADNVTFIPFETKPASLQGQGQNSLISFSPNYIFYYNMAYDWEGNYFGTIVKRGQGRFEEAEGGTIILNNGLFYSKGSKFIEYDITGKPTGKVRNLYATREFGTSDFLRRGSSFTSVGANFVVYDFPTTLYYFDRNFETIASRVVYVPYSLPTRIASIGEGKYISFYKENVLFYSFFNETIFYVTDTSLEPQWIVNFDEQLRLPKQVMLNSFYLLRGALSGRIESSELVQLTDHKHKIIACYETDKYMFFNMTEIIQLAEVRGKTPPDPYIIYYDKATGKTTRVKGKGFEDDILGFPVLAI